MGQREGIHTDSCCRDRHDRPLWRAAGRGNENEEKKKKKKKKEENEKIEKNIETKIKKENTRENEDRNEEKKKTKNKITLLQREATRFQFGKCESLRISVSV
jgi:hypothetical protein